MGIIALLCILGAIICFIVELVRTGFSLTIFGFLLLSIFFAVTFIPSLSS